MSYCFAFGKIISVVNYLNIFNDNIMSSYFELQKLIRKFNRKIHQISEEEFSFKSSLEKWSKKEILGHLIDSSKYFINRIENIFTKQEPFNLKRFEQDDLVKLHNYQEQDSNNLIILFQSLNIQIMQVMKNCSEEMRAKTFNFGEQKVTVDQLMKSYLAHLNHHLEQIFNQDGSSIKAINHVSLESAFEQLSNAPSEFVELLKYGELVVEFYKPDKIDKQQPHTRDEIYIISSGSGAFDLEGKIFQVKENDVLFVKAHDKHKFINFTDDFSTWVIFYGLER